MLLPHLVYRPLPLLKSVWKGSGTFKGVRYTYLREAHERGSDKDEYIIQEQSTFPAEFLRNKGRE